MIVRIIAGEFGGRKIDAPDRKSTHAMSERGRNALFNSLGGDVESTRVLDAFAGSGAIGIEALSRGASEAVFVEKDRIACKIIAKNITMLDLEERAELIRTSVSNWLDTASPRSFDLIFADPPYHDPQFSTVKRLFGLLKPGALMVLSHSGRGEVPIQDGIVVVDNRSYGNLHLTSFRRDA
ncbi:MAG TPA: 16S rRNA (guanine(966)-N(2))-methyltransferase RsmD [Candidatus Saccharimonadales bacterium]